MPSYGNLNVWFVFGVFFPPHTGSCGIFLINKPLNVSPVGFALISTGIGCKATATSS